MFRIIMLFSFLGVFSSHAQREPILDQFWNSYSYLNPATNGMDYKLHTAVQFNTNFKGDHALLGSFGLAINSKHSIGFNYLSTPYGKKNSFSINVGQLNYNYKFHFLDSTTHFLSLGIGIGMGYVKKYDDKSYYIPAYSQQLYYPTSSFTTFPKLNVGIAYRFKNLFLGAGVTQITKDFLARTKGPENYILNSTVYVMGSYDIRIVENLHVKPQIIFNYTNKNYYYTHANLMVTLFKNYAIGASYWFGNPVYYTNNGNASTILLSDFQLNAQVDIKNKFRIGYSIGSLKSYYFTHEFVVGFQLK